MDFVLVSTATWNTPLWTNKQHIARRLAEAGHRVLFVESLNLRRPRLTVRDVCKVVTRVFRTTIPVSSPGPGIRLAAPLAYSGSRLRLIRRLSLANAWRRIRREIADLGFVDPVLWLYNPVAVHLASLLPWSRIVYHCVDDLTAVPGIDRALIAECETIVGRQADLVLCSSRPLFEMWRERAPLVIYMPNAADTVLFGAAAPDAAFVSERNRLGAQVAILYYGSLAGYKVDFALIEKIARSRPQWGIWLYGMFGEGESTTDAGELKGLSNVHFRPAVPPKALAGVVAAVDVCILPHAPNAYTRASFPMKFFECLAAGKPVVGRELESLREFTDLYYTAGSAEDFVIAIERAVREDNGSRALQRRERAKAFSWERRIKDIERLLSAKRHESGLPKRS